MDEPVEDGVGERGVTDGGVPFGDRDLAGDQGGGPPAAILDDLEQIAALVGGHGRDRPIVEDQEPHLGECATVWGIG